MTLDYIDTITLAVNDTNMGSIKMLYAFTPLDTVDLSTIHSNYTVQDGTVLTGTLGTNSTNPNHPSADNRKISVAAGATVMLSNMDITGVDNSNFKWAGLTLLGDATIVLDDNTSNYIRGFYYQYPGIYVPGGATLTICGSGELTSESGKGDQLYDPWWAPGIGGAYNNSCGNIVVEGGTITTIGGYGASLGGGYRGACGNIAIHGGTVNASSIGCGNSATIDSILITGGIVNATAKDLQAGIGCDGGGTVNHIVITGGTINATGGRYAAGIGSGYCATVNHITITGGTITATGGQNGAGIGAGEGRNGLGHCGEIVIASTVTSVTAQKGTNNTNVNNIGHGDGATCDTVIVGGQPYTDPDTSTYTYTGTGSSDNVQHYITAATPLPDGRYTVLRGTQVVAKATPKANHHLASWSDGATVNASGTDTISTNGSVTITAFFEHDPYIVNVAVLDTNSGNAVVIYNDSAAISLPVGTDTNAVVAISATAKYGYHFDRWEEVDTMYNFTLYSHTADTSVRVTGDRLFYAYFEPNIYTISTYTADTTMGTAAVDNNMQGPVAANQPSVQAEYNSWLMLTATPKRGYHFVQWEEADSVYSHTADTFVVVNADRSFTAVFAQDSHSFVEMGDGLRWATNNIGADNQWDVGDYFAWGETEPKNSYSWSTYRFNANGSNTDFTRYTGSDYDTLLAEDDAATANWGRGWRMATRDEWQTLMNTNNYSWQWTNNYNNTGNRGFTVTRLTGPCAGNTIFLPANGYMDNYWLNNRQSCRYWSSTIASDNINAWKTTMDNSNFSMHEAARYLGGAVRAVGHTSMISVAAQSDDTTMGTAGLMVATPGATAAAVLEQRVTVDTGATVTLSATPKIGYIFVRWMEADTTYSLSADTVITVMGERSMKAFFAVHPVDTLILAVNDTSMGSIAIEGAFTPTDTVDLATLTGDYTVQDGTVLTGTLTNDYKISVAAGASVLLKGMIIPGISTAEHPWAGLSLLGDATLFLDDSSYVKGYHSRYPGIHVPAGSTLTIRGVGILTAQPCSRAAAIGGGYEIDNGNIVIESGTIHAHGYYAAGIGGGYRAQSCGNITIRGGNIDASSIGGGDSETIDSITITGGTVIATGNDFEAGVGTGHTGTVNHIIITGGTVIAQGGTRAAGIGGGIFAHCGEIVIDSTVTLVTSSKGHLTDTNIGTGFQGTFDTIIVAGQGYTDVSNPFSYSGNGRCCAADRSWCRPPRSLATTSPVGVTAPPSTPLAPTPLRLTAR